MWRTLSHCKVPEDCDIVILFLPQHRHSRGDQPCIAALQGPPRLDHGFQHLLATWLQDRGADQRHGERDNPGAGSPDPHARAAASAAAPAAASVAAFGAVDPDTSTAGAAAHTCQNQQGERLWVSCTKSTGVLLPPAEAGVELESEKLTSTQLFHSICEPSCVSLVLLG